MSFMESVLSGGGRPDSMNRQEGFCGILLAIIAADGHIANEEVVDFHAMIKKANILRGASQNYISQMIDKCIRILRSQGMEKLLELSTAGLTPDLYEGVFANACDMVFSDGNVDPGEVAVMERIKQLLNISDQFAADVAEVMKAKASV